MLDSYVCSGAMMRCTMGDKPAKLTVLPSRTVFLCGQPMANISDHKSMVNLAPFGRCRSLGFPDTAAATAAHLGKLTPMPCKHNTPSPWLSGKTDYFDKSQPSLLKSCKLQCMWGGTISLVDDGQKGEGTQYVNKSGKLSADDIQAESNEKNELKPETILDGIQLALDVAGFAPGVGAFADLTNAAIYAFRGDMVNAGLSLVAAVPGVGDAAAGAKLVGKGMKMAKAAEKTTETAAKTIKTADSALSATKQAEKGLASGQKVPFGELTNRPVSQKSNMAPGQKVPFGELTNRPVSQSSNMAPGQKVPFGELTRQSHSSTNIPTSSSENIIEQASKTVSDSKPINANTLEELEHTKKVLEADEMSRKTNRFLDYEA